MLGVKNDRITEDEYIQGYRQLMNASWKAHRAEWLEFIAQEEPLALACFCTAQNATHVHPDGSVLCHRFLLNDILGKLCVAKGIPYFYYGELTP